MLFGKKPVFIGLHFAKTGGTSIRAHAAKNLRKGEFFPYGVFAHANNFFSGRPMLAEMSPRQKAKFRFLYGHGVSTDVLHHFADREIALFVVCRDPYKRFLSSLKHVVRTQRQFGGTVDPREVYESQPANPFANSVMKHFGDLAPDGVSDQKERLLAVLRCFRFVMSTDDLNAQTRPFFNALDLPEMTEAKRVYKEEADIGSLSEQEIRARDDLDAFVNEAINDYYASGEAAKLAKGPINPFGFDQSQLNARMKAFSAAALPIEEEIEEAYVTLFGFLDRHGRLEAAKVLIDAGQQSRRTADIFARFCRDTGRSFEDQDLPSRNLCYQAEVFLQLKQRAEASDSARRAIEADPDNPMAYYLAGRAAIEEQRYTDGAAHLERAAELNPTHTASFRYLATAYQHLGRAEDADKALKAAKGA